MTNMWTAIHNHCRHSYWESIYERQYAMCCGATKMIKTPMLLVKFILSRLLFDSWLHYWPLHLGHVINHIIFIRMVKGKDTYKKIDCLTYMKILSQEGRFNNIYDSYLQVLLTVSGRDISSGLVFLWMTLYIGIND